MSVAVAQTSSPTAAPATQQPFAIPPYKNLKVLPKDITRPQLLGSMKFFAQSLGVRCTYCHVGTEGQPLSTFDFASDAKDHKDTARGMIQLVAHLNKDHLPAITGLADAKVTCFTCHRGSTKPATEMPLPQAAPAQAPATPVPPKAERGTG
jgi:hypothetical protein